jgi:hypothetical protein
MIRPESIRGARHVKSFMLILVAAGFLVGCEKSTHLAKRPLSKDEISAQEITALSRELRGKNGSDAFMDLQSYGDAGFDAITRAMVKGDITPAGYKEWISEMATRWENGGQLVQNFDEKLFTLADKSPAFTRDIVEGFFSKYPVEELDRLGMDKRPAARKVAEAALLEKARH